MTNILLKGDKLKIWKITTESTCNQSKSYKQVKTHTLYSSSANN